MQNVLQWKYVSMYLRKHISRMRWKSHIPTLVAWEWRFLSTNFYCPIFTFSENKQNWADKANTVLTEGRDRGLLMEDLWTQILVNSCIKKLTSGLCSYEQQHLSTWFGVQFSYCWRMDMSNQEWSLDALITMSWSVSNLAGIWSSGTTVQKAFPVFSPQNTVDISVRVFLWNALKTVKRPSEWDKNAQN